MSASSPAERGRARVLPRALALLLSLLPLTATAAAQVSYDLGGEVGATFGVAVDGTLPVAAAALKLSLDGEVGSGFFPVAVFKAELHAAYDVVAPSPFDLRLGRTYVTAYLGPVDLTVGNQVVSWGSTDAFSPVDVINPQDLSNPVAGQASQKLPVPLVRAVLHAPNDLTFDAVVVPAYVPSRLPGERWLPSADLPTDLPPGVQVVGVQEPIVAKPAFTLGNVQFGVRATVDLDVLGGADASVTYYHGFSHEPTAGYLPLPAGAPGQLVIQPVVVFTKVDLFGADFSAVVGDFVVRGEVAYTLTAETPAVRVPGGELPAPQAPDRLDVVLGAETILPFGPFVTLQAMYGHAAAYTDVTDRPVNASDTFATALAGTYDVTNRATVDLAWLHDWTDGSGVVRPSFAYTFADGFTGTAEATVFYGADGTLYGGWRKNSQLLVGATFAF